MVNVIVLSREPATFPSTKKRVLHADDSDEEVATRQRVVPKLAPPIRRSPSIESEDSRGSRHTHQEPRRVVRCRFVARPSYASLLEHKI